MSYKAVIIDDEIWTRKVIRSLGEWEKYGIRIAGEASDGEYGLELIRQVKPDIILTDVCMPQMNGLELIERLRSERDPVQVIFISGYDDYSYVRSAMKLGVVDYLLKPVKPEELNRQLMVCTEKLARLAREKEEGDLSAGFLREEWAEEFYRIREETVEALHGGHPDILERKLERMGAFLRERMGSSPDKSSMISVYYMLIQGLQRYILGRGYRPEEIFGEQSTVFVFDRDSTPGMMLDFVTGLYRQALLELRRRSRERGKLDIGQIRRYMEEHYREGITLEETAALFFVSKEYLSKAFKASEGKGFSEYLTALRMEKARELLLDYRVPIKEVGEQVGYMDQAHFYRTFKKYFGKTPGEMRPV